MLQFRYLDKRLKFVDIAPYLTQIYGGQNTHELIWTPTVYVANQRTSAIMGSGVKDLLISISSYGMVMLNTRYSIFNFKKHPAKDVPDEFLFHNLLLNLFFILYINFHNDCVTDRLWSVRLNFRLEATLNCGLRLEKFPFDVQECPLVFESCKLSLLFV